MTKVIVICALSYTAAIISVFFGTIFAEEWSRNLTLTITSLIHYKLQPLASRPMKYYTECANKTDYVQELHDIPIDELNNISGMKISNIFIMSKSQYRKLYQFFVLF